MKSSVITFPGSNCDRDMDVALKKFGFKNKMVWHDDTELPKSDLVVLPGGFSYGDYLRCGSMASKSKIMQSVINFAKGGGKVMGICNGFQILVESSLLPGVLLRNKYLEFICKNVYVKINNKKNSFFKDFDKDRFRKDLGDLIPAYTEVAKRLGILHEQSNMSAVNVTKISSIKKRK